MFPVPVSAMCAMQWQGLRLWTDISVSCIGAQTQAAEEVLGEQPKRTPRKPCSLQAGRKLLTPGLAAQLHKTQQPGPADTEQRDLAEKFDRLSGCARQIVWG